jgi:RNA polymerase sigma-70 factor (ECF subfamily)
MKAPRITPEEIGIIKRAQAGDKSAFDELFQRYKPFVEKLLTLYLKDYDESKDLTNEVFMKVHDKLSLFKTYNSFGGWLRIMTKNTAIDYLRHIGNKTIPMNTENGGLTFEEPIDSTEEDVVNQISYEQLFKVFNKLPEKTRRIFELFYAEDMTVGEISKVLSIPTGTIKSTLSRTRKRIKK